MASGGPSAAAPSRQTQRLLEELRLLQANPSPFLRNLDLPKEEDSLKLNVLTGTMIGPEGSDYANGHFDFFMEFPKEYPFKPPIFRFKTQICHPNVRMEDFEACHEQLLASWKPKIKLLDFLTEIHKLLAEPNYDVPVDNIPVDGSPLADDYAPTGDNRPDSIPPLTVKDRKTARQWTRWYAQPKS